MILMYWACSWALCDCKKLLVMHYSQQRISQLCRILPSVPWQMLWSKCWLRWHGGMEDNKDFSAWERQCLFPAAALMAPLCWEALKGRSTISRIPTAHVATGPCQAAAESHGATSTQGVAAWSDGRGSETVTQLWRTSSGEETKKTIMQIPIENKLTRWMCMQVVFVHQIVNKHPINVTEYSFPKLSERWTGVLTELYYCSS